MELPEELQPVLQRYGGAPVLKRSYRESSRRMGELQRVAGGCLGAVGLVWNHVGQVVLVRHDPAVWAVEWATPGGMTEPGETPEETLRREVLEETGLEVEAVIGLTHVFDMVVRDDTRTVEGFLFQFEAMAKEGPLQPGEDIMEARWFNKLPEDMAYREDYEETFEKGSRRFLPR